MPRSPSNRPPTAIDARVRRDLIAGDRPLHHATSADCWLTAKERQRLEDGTSAAIDAARLARLESMPSHWPGTRPALRAVEAPMVEGHALSEVEAARQAAIPAIRAAIRRTLNGRPGGDLA